MYTQINEELRDQLQSNIIASGVMGSHAHGLNCEGSDRDFLYLYFDPRFGYGVNWELNGWQFKNGNIDENYQEIRVFVRNLIIGESPADYEALRHGFKIVNSHCNPLLNDLLNQLISNCNSYALVKAYIGYLKKDCNSLARLVENDCPIDSIGLRKKVAHIIRGMSTIKHFIIHDYPYQFDGDASGFLGDFRMVL